MSPTRFLVQSSILIFVVIAHCVLSGSQLTGQQLSIVGLGYTDFEHTRGDGSTEANTAFLLSESGHTAGSSQRFFGSETSYGYSGWYYNGRQLVDISLTSAGYVGSNGERTTAPSVINQNHQIAGISYRYSEDGAYQGQWAWRYSEGAHTVIGLYGSEFAGNNGYHFNTVRFINNQGHVVGWVEQPDDNNLPLGRVAWLYNGQETVDIGPSGFEHTGSDGRRSSAAIRNLSNGGHVFGSAVRFNGSSFDQGRSCWLYNGNSTVIVGLIDSEHTRNDGYRSNLTAGYGLSLNDSGQAIGYAARYFADGSNAGQTAWIYDGVQTKKIGLMDSDHTSGLGTYFNDPRMINAQGQVIGSAFRGGGDSAWFYDGAVTHRIGLTSGSFIASNGRTNSFAYWLDDQGRVLGYSRQYAGNTSAGRQSWIYQDGEYTFVAPTDDRFVNQYGFTDSGIARIFDSGLVQGSSVVYANGIENGDNSWVYDLNTDQIYHVNLSSRPGDGFSENSFEFFSGDGIGIGSYTLFDDIGNDLGDRLFYFSLETGAVDLETLLEGGLEGNGWQTLLTLRSMNSSGEVLGHGRLSGQTRGTLVYLLRPYIVPEPGVLAISGVILLTVIVKRRRK